MLNEVRVINLISNEIIFRHYSQNDIYDLKWRDNQSLLLLDDIQLLSVNIKKEKKLMVLYKADNLASIHTIDKQHFLAIQDYRSSKILFQQTLPFKEWNNKFIYNDKNKKGIYSINGNIDDISKLIMAYKDNITTLGKLNTQTAKITPYIKTQDELRLIEYSASNKNILISINQRFAIFNIENNRITYITSEDEFIGDASFSTDGKNVLFSVKDHEEWKIKNYKIADKQITNKLKGFRYIRPYKENYIVADAQENLYFYNTTTQEQLKLNHRISYEPNTYWSVRGDFIYWSKHDLVTTTFSELDISNIRRPRLTKKTFDYNKVRPNFSISADASTFTYAQRGEENSTILSFVLKD